MSEVKKTTETEGDDNNSGMKTIPQDARYHNCNATKWCYATYVDYHKCTRLLGEGHAGCEQFKKIYKTICPNAWIDRWDKQIEECTFPADLPPKENECHCD